jgi:hypothetical protein
MTAFFDVTTLTTNTVTGAFHDLLYEKLATVKSDWEQVLTAVL